MPAAAAEGEAAGEAAAAAESLLEDGAALLEEDGLAMSLLARGRIHRIVAIVEAFAQLCVRIRQTPCTLSSFDGPGLLRTS